ncbi:GNAT family N-acetyltransferase [Pelagibius sp. 7325]|uniref:GNAT family N-acetyltransferase n=1 Tax=Pelagibius sp. 7325 TaxID=3131994 RepID=UPI0030EC931E
MRDVPNLTTKRLRLRGHTRDDFDHLTALWGDPEVVRHITGSVSSASDSWMRLLNSAGHWALQGFGYWAVEERGSGCFVGQVGLADFKRGLGPRFDGMPEAGWVLSPAFHGKGYATEAVETVLAWGEANIAMTRCVCMISPDHAASLRVAEKCGFTPFAETEFKGSPVVLLERLK